MCPSNVRIATIQDELKLFRLINRLFEDNPGPANLAVDDKRVWDHVNACCRGQKGIAGVIDTPDGEDLCASVGIFPVTHWASSDWYLCQHWLYVDEPFRKGGKIYRDLLQFARWHRADMSVRCGREMPLENSFVTKDDIMPRLRLWRRTGRIVGVLSWLTE